MHHYQFSGLTIRSALPLPELPAVPAGPADVEIDLGSMADLDGAGQAPRYRVGEDGVDVSIPWAANFRITGGCRILVAPKPGADARAVRLYLLGSGFAAIFHQRGLLPFHASVVSQGGTADGQGACVGFVGESGAGKSTMAAVLLRAGYQLLSDDVCVTRIADDGTIRAFPSCGRIKMCFDTQLAMGQGPEALQALMPGVDKTDVAQPLVQAPGGLPLRLLYELVSDDTADAPRSEAVDTPTALRILLGNTFRGYFLTRSQAQRRFLDCTRLAALLAVRRLVRPRGWQHMDAAAALIARDLAALPKGPPAMPHAAGPGQDRTGGLGRIVAAGLLALAVMVLAPRPAPAQALAADRPGQVYAPGETARITVTAESGPLDWHLETETGQQVAAGALDRPADGTVPPLDLPLATPGYYELAVRAPGKAMPARLSLAVLPPPARPSARYGVMTHFAQGWDTDIVPLIARAGIGQVRDEMYWNHVEREPGRYAVPDRVQTYMQALSAQGITPLLVLSFENRLYDDGNTPHTDAGRAAFAAYGRFLVERFAREIPAVEVWNEFNGSFCKGPCSEDRPGSYAALLRTTTAALKQARPRLTVAGGAAVLLPEPWFEALFANGALDSMDAVVIHPYRAVPEGVERDISRLREQIRRHNGGRGKPIWATEFGRQEHTEEGRRWAAAYLVRHATLMLNTGVERLYWYLLRDDGKFAGMGLLRAADSPLGRYAPAPAYVAYATFIRLVGTARPQGRLSSDRRTRIYRFDRGGTPLQIAWSPDGPAEVELAAAQGLVLTDLMGRQTRLPAQGGVVRLTLTPTPVYLDGPVQSVRDLGRQPLLADSRDDFAADGAGTWSYGSVVEPQAEGRGCSGAGYQPDAVRPLQWRQDEWGGAWRGTTPYLQINAAGSHPGISGKSQMWAVRRWTAARPGPLTLIGRVQPSSDRGDGVCALILADGRPLWAASLGGEAEPQQDFRLPVTVQAGTRLDFVLTPGPALDINHDSTSFDVQIEAGGR